MRKPKLQGFGNLSIVSRLGKVDKPGLKSDPPEKPSFSTLPEVSPNSLHVGLEPMKSTHISAHLHHRKTRNAASLQQVWIGSC